MTATTLGTGRGATPATGARRTPPDPVLARVLAVSLLGAGLATAVIAWGDTPRVVLDGTVTGAAWLLPLLIAVTCLGELTVVRLRHGRAVEELTLCEAAIIIDVLLLPPREALLAAVAGLLAASVIQRRPLVKGAFNLATYTAGTAVLILITHLVAGTPGRVTLGVVAGVTLGTVAFAAVNLSCLAQILAVVSDQRPGHVIRTQARLSAYMALGAVATGLPTAVIGLTAPVLLPFLAMPALAVTFAYRAAAQESEERARSAVLLRLSHALAARDDIVRQFVVLVREAFDADLAAVVLAGADVAISVDAAAPTDPHQGPVPPDLAAHCSVPVPTVRTDDLPGDLRHLLVVPLAGGGRDYGAVVLGLRARRRGRLARRDLMVLAPLANALATAISGGEHLNRLVEETSKLQAIAEQSTEGILMVDGAGAVQMWSRALTELTDVASDEAVGRALAELLDIPDPAERDRLLPATADNPKVAVEVTIHRPDGEPRRLRLAHSAVFAAGGALVRDVVVVTDLTREHRTERLKSDFIATISHELRTPLTPIIGYVDLLRTRGDQLPPQRRRDCLDLLADRAAHLARLVEDLLTASHVSDPTQDLSLRVTAGIHDLAGLVRQVAAGLDNPRVTVEVPDGPVPARCDAGRVVQVVTNLIENALKYSADPAPVGVRVRLDGDRAQVDVTDRGRGIPSDQTEKIFDKFHRVEDPMTMSTSGTGLGLFIARRLARAMGGDLTVASTLYVGSVFTFTLERAGQPSGPARPGRSGA
jgi:PAS domain S-box-containing protein